jgi:SpoVK/Ycf46/Vps4 family AAA+-type ATPase
LSSLFSKAENKNWILFFDEADALFGKRTEQRDAHDRHANQEVAYLLQRVEDYPGLVILASNFKSNIDPAFTRRFQSMIHFPMPKQDERFKLWKMAFPKQVKISKEIDWMEIAKTYQVSGSNIMNIVQYCCIQTLEEKARILTHSMLLKGIKREYEKEDRMM